MRFSVCPSTPSPFLDYRSYIQNRFKFCRFRRNCRSRCTVGGIVGAGVGETAGAGVGDGLWGIVGTYVGGGTTVVVHWLNYLKRP